MQVKLMIWRKENILFCVYHFSFSSFFFNVTHNITKLISKHFNSILLFTITLSRQQNSWFEKWRSFFLCVYHFSFPSFFFNVTRNITKSISKHFNSILLLTIFCHVSKNHDLKKEDNFSCVSITSLSLLPSSMLLTI